MERQKLDSTIAFINRNQKKKSVPSTISLKHELLTKAVILDQPGHILLNDKHASKYSKGSSVWLKAKGKERAEIEQKFSGHRSLSERINRIVDIFRHELNCQPRFWRKLKESEIESDLRSQTIGKIEGFPNLYVECSLKSDKVRNNVKSFRSSKIPTRTTKKPADPSTPSRSHLHASGLKGAPKLSLYATSSVHSIVDAELAQSLPTNTTPASPSSEAPPFHNARGSTLHNIFMKNTDNIIAATCLPHRNDNTHAGNIDWVKNTRLGPMDFTNATTPGSDWNPEIKLSASNVLDLLVKHSSLSTTDAMNVIMNYSPPSFENPHTYPVPPPTQIEKPVPPLKQIDRLPVENTFEDIPRIDDFSINNIDGDNSLSSVFIAADPDANQIPPFVRHMGHPPGADDGKNMLLGESCEGAGTTNDPTLNAEMAKFDPIFDLNVLEKDTFI